jgi:hypothetical protein
LQRELGVNGGSVINFAKEMIHRSTKETADFDIFKDGAGINRNPEEIPGLIVLNCGQLLYSYNFDRPMTLRSWNAMPRRSMIHEGTHITDWNKVEGNRDAKEHIQYVFEHVICDANFVDPTAEIYIVAIEGGAENLLEILDEDSKLRSKSHLVIFSSIR